MPKIISAFSGESPLGDTIAKLGASMFGGNTTDNALKNEQLYALQRENTERDNYAKLVADAGIMPTANNKLAQAMIIAAGIDPRNSAYLGRMDAATQYGADDPRTANWQIAAGDPYSATAPAFKSTLAEQTRNNDLQSTDRRYNVDQDVGLRKWLNENISAADQAQSTDRRYAADLDLGAKRYSADQSLNASKYNTDVDANTDRFKHQTLSEADRIASGDRRYAVDQSQLTERTKQTPAFDPITGQPVFRPANNLSTVQPIISEADRKGILLGQNWGNLPALVPEQRQVLGANPSADRLGSPKNYILPSGQTIITYDGITSAKDGQPLPPGGYLGTVQGSATDTGVTKAVQTDLQTDLVAADKFTMLGNGMLQLTKEHPEAFGLVGKVTGMAQEANQALNAVSTLFGGEQGVDTAIDTARSELMRLGKQNLVPSLYNPNIPKVQMLGGLMLYSAASALGGQENRSVSDADIKKMEQIIGDPQSMFESAQSISTKVGLAMKIVAAHKQLAQQYLGTHPGTTTIPPETGLVDMAIATALSDQNDGVQPGAQPTVVDPNAQPVQIRGADDYNALPPGAKYIDPNGIPRIKGAR